MPVFNFELIISKHADTAEEAWTKVVDYLPINEYELYRKSEVEEISGKEHISIMPIRYSIDPEE